MAKNSVERRKRALSLDPSAYRREVPENVVEVCDITSVSCGQEINLVGRLLLADKTGNISKFGVFTRIKDRDFITFERVEWGGHSIPVFLLKNEENVLAANSLFHYGDVIMLRGAKEQLDGTDIFIATEVVLLSKTVGDVYDSNIDFRKRSNLHDHRHLQLIRDPGRVVNFKKCSVVLRSIREFLYGQGYEELNLTMLQEKFEAGLAKPFTTRVNELDRDMYLRLTSELFLRKLMIAGFSKIFEIGKSFRNQGATGSMLPQFTILELYRSFATSEAVESLLQDMLCYVLVQLYGLPSIPTNGGVIDCAGDWPRYDFLEEIHRLTGLHYDESRPIAERLSLLDRLGVDSPSVVNDYTVATALYSSVMSKITGPAFLRNLPAAQSPIFKLGDNKSVVDETILVINGMLVADLVNPERDPSVIRKRMEEQLSYRQGERSDGVNEDVIRAMSYGLPPCRGIGMGIERLCMLLLNISDIRDVELFPVF